MIPTDAASAATSTATRDEIVERLVSRGYGYRDRAAFERARARHYPALKHEVYLDYAASPPAPITPVQSLATSLASTLYANPHSASTAGTETALLIAKTRSRVLSDLFNVPVSALDQWDVVFTPGGATRGIQMIGSAWKWRKGSDSDGQIGLSYLRESHTSLVGLRGFALSHSARVESHSSTEALLLAASRQASNVPYPTLYTYPAQCNATGARLGLDFARKIKKADPSAVVLIDAAAYSATKVLDLGSIQYDDEGPDAVVGSFYKIFGWPTSLGFLIIRRASARHFVSTPHFGGGSISSLSLSAPFSFTPRTSPSCVNPTIHQQLEQGTVPYLEIVALSHAMDWFQATYGSLNDVELHVQALRGLAHELLSDLRHASGDGVGEPVFVEHRAFRPSFLDLTDPDVRVDPESFGPTIGFSLLAPRNSGHRVDIKDFRETHVGTAHLARLAIVNGISLRTGGLCNAGVWTKAFGVDDQELGALEAAGRACWDDQEFSPFYPHRPLGIARISFGAASTVDDVLRFVAFVKKFFVRDKDIVELSRPLKTRHKDAEEVRRAKLGTLLLYPIKSCAAQSIESDGCPDGWPLLATGLLYDREFMLVDPASGKALSQKKYPRMALIKPSINLERCTLCVQAKGMDELILPLPELVGHGTPPLSSTSSEQGSTRDDSDSVDVPGQSTLLCGELVTSSRVSPLADEWFAAFLNLASVQLHRMPLESTARHAHFDPSTSLDTKLPTVPLPLRLSNESPFLLVTESSVRRVSDWIASSSDETSAEAAAVIAHTSFRPNLVVDDLDLDDDGAVEPFWEDAVDSVQVGGCVFANLGRCRRCLMVGINQETGEKTKEPLSTLSRYRKSTTNGRVEFGVHMHWREDIFPLGRQGDRDDAVECARVKVGDEVSFRIAPRD